MLFSMGSVGVLPCANDEPSMHESADAFIPFWNPFDSPIESECMAANAIMNIMLEKLLRKLRLSS